jgi:hypothetical protein
MKKILTSQTILACKHKTGLARMDAPENLLRFQNFITIEGSPVLCGNFPISDPMLQRINSCTNMGPTIKPCNLTLTAEAHGFSSLIFIEDRPVCLDTLTGLTDGTPPGTVQYNVRDPGQSFVSEE